MANLYRNPASIFLLTFLALGLVLVSFCPQAALAVSSIDEKDESSRAEYIERAKEAVRKYMQESELGSSWSEADSRIEIVGPIILLPRHKHLHSHPSVTSTEAARGDAHVLDQLGKPVSNAVITLRRVQKKATQSSRGENGDTVSMLVTDEKGHFDLGSIPPGRYTLTVEHENFLDTSVTLKFDSHPLKPFTLIMPHGLRGSMGTADFVGWVPDLSPVSENSFPSAIGLAAVCTDDEIIKWFDVFFEAGRTTAKPSELDGFVLDEPVLYPIPKREVPRIRADLEGFYNDAFDIERGPERFYPYLPEDIYFALGYWEREEVKSLRPAQEVRRQIALELDDRIHRALMQFEGMAPPVTSEAWAVSGPATTAESIVREQRTRTRALAADQAHMKSSLQKIGALGSEHATTTRRYLARSLGQGPIFRDQRELRGKPVKSAPAYAVIFDDIYLFFVKDSSGLRIIHRDFPDVF